jgi:hypothetical protein
MEPYDPIPGRVPRKVAIDRKKKEYSGFSIDHLLAEKGKNQNIQALISLKGERSHGFRFTTLMTPPSMTFPTKDGLKRRPMKMVITESSLERVFD